IDADNASPDSLDPVLTVLAELGTVNIRRAYGNWQKPGLKGWANIIHRHAIEPQQQFDVAKGKSATDMKMTIDAMDLLFGGRVHGFGIMSSDSDFMPLAVRIKQDGLDVYGFGTAKTPEAFREACTRFIDVTKLAEAQEADTPTTEGKSSTKRPIDAELVDLLGAALRASHRDERGFASLAEVGQRAGNRSSFDARSYGYNGLSQLIQAIPNFTTERREGGRMYVKRVR
ncbi:MAG TPA: NYN domain-containing protein, partial [Allosphingosinicella sp.]